MMFLIAECAANGKADAMGEDALREGGDVAQFERTAPGKRAGRGGSRPENLRLDFSDSDQISVRPKEAVERPDVDCARTKPRWVERHWLGSFTPA